MSAGRLQTGKIGRWLKAYIIRRLAWLAAVTPGACLVMLIPLKVWPWELARHFHLYWMAGLAGLALMCCGFRWWRRAALNAALLGILAIPLRTYYFSAPDAVAGAGAVPEKTAGTVEREPEGGGKVTGENGTEAGRVAGTAESREFRLISFNLLMIGRRPEETLRALEAADPDMLLLLEFTRDWRKTLQPVLDRYPWRLGLPQRDSFGIWFGSRLPLENPRLVVTGDGPFPTVVARARIGGRTVGFVGAHPMNPVFPSWTSLQREQFEAYPALLREAGGDARIFAGDLNCTPFSLTFQDFLAETGLRDSARGRGLTNTWSGPALPLELGLPIDHVLVSEGLRVLERKTGPRLGSDHRWLEVRLRAD